MPPQAAGWGGCDTVKFVFIHVFCVQLLCCCEMSALCVLRCFCFLCLLALAVDFPYVYELLQWRET